MGNMRVTYCTAEMEFVDVKALEDSTVSTLYNQDDGNISLLKNDADEIVSVKNYATTELNLFVLDGTKEIMTTPTDICFMSDSKSKTDCTFEDNPIVKIDFTENHTSSGITLFFGNDYPEQVRLTWYTLGGTKIIGTVFNPDSLIYTCNQQVTNYGRIDVEFIKTRFPCQYASLQYVKYGILINWENENITKASVLEEIDVTSNTLSINTAKISILDTNNDFDIANDNGAWKSVQKTQEIKIKEKYNDKWINMGSFFINKSSFNNNIADFEMIDAIGLLDQYMYYNGTIYDNESVGTILEDIFDVAKYKYYSIDEDIYDITVSGWLGIQTCRQALQMVCFSIGAIADDSRGNTIKIYKPDRYVKSTIETSRKFNNKSKITLDNYVSGVSVGYSTYQLATESTEIYKGILNTGKTKITFSNPFDTTTISTTVGNIIELKTNYLIIENDTSQECIISGTPYDAVNCSYVTSVNLIDSGETENIVEHNGCTLVNTELLPLVADNLLKYYQLRKNLSLDFILDYEAVGQWVDVMTRDGFKSTSLIESQSINLTGGFLATSKCRGYSLVNTENYYTGNELITGEGGIV